MACLLAYLNPVQVIGLSKLNFKRWFRFSICPVKSKTIASISQRADLEKPFRIEPNMRPAFYLTSPSQGAKLKPRILSFELEENFLIANYPVAPFRRAQAAVTHSFQNVSVCFQLFEAFFLKSFSPLYRYHIGPSSGRNWRWKNDLKFTRRIIPKSQKLNEWHVFELEIYRFLTNSGSELSSDWLVWSKNQPGNQVSMGTQNSNEFRSWEKSGFESHETISVPAVLRASRSFEHPERFANYSRISKRFQVQNFRCNAFS